MIRSVVKYALSLLLSLFLATIAITPLEGGPEPGSFPRLIWVIIFFTVLTILFAWDAGYLSR